jgi:NH3-dependent NAD+ synthetase
MHFLVEQVSLRSNLASYNVRARVRGQATYATACMRASMIDRSGTHMASIFCLLE